MFDQTLYKPVLVKITKDEKSTAPQPITTTEMDQIDTPFLREFVDTIKGIVAWVHSPNIPSRGIALWPE
jgi:hypothetical protein